MPEQNMEKFDQTGATQVEELLSELSHYRKQSERLRKVNELYGHIAGILDLTSMIEAYSIWLAQYVPHELIGYHNLTRQRMHMFCSSHGPDRRQVIDIAERLLTSRDTETRGCLLVDNFFAHTWGFSTPDCKSLLVLLRKDNRIGNEEIELINESLTILAEPLKRTLDYEKIFEQARKDALTGLPNRLVFEERIECIMERARRHNHPLTLAALDLDHFKEVNDSMGHLMGDRVLQQVAAVLQKEIRATDLLARMGGDEFLLVLSDTDIESARQLSQRLCRAVAQLQIPAGDHKLGVSIGLMQWEPGMDREEWLDKADDMLYQAKAAGRSRVARA
ncbi:hypothetical protein GF1_07290 [Desulfolithobacter dissulfuricans]|uniref:diguanylate cyclase n=1 Tax=Desulfolithobacter dissulfuricans TaxID=2795293 RepID=A0A915XJU8_9BACT|nr:GGDEF domain-containing protein [Desulfolithobacter dissulfuricans]BCO08353.1 hypothetical protein GF1_07290 [Desulfolithobacter dissulfuricans]